MIALPEGTQGKALALAIAVLAVCVFYFAILSPLFAFYAANAQTLQDRQDVFRRYQNAAQDLPRLRAGAKQVQDQSGNGAVLLPGESDAVAAAGLQASLKDMIEQAGAKLTTAQTLPPESQSGFRKVGMRVAFSGDLSLLTTVLLDMETAHPVLSVNSLDIHGGEDEGALAITMDVYALRAE